MDKHRNTEEYPFDYWQTSLIGNIWYY